MEPLRNILKYARLNARLTQKEVAEIMGVSKAVISQWETGHRVPNALNRKRLAAIYKIDVRVLL